MTEVIQTITGFAVVIIGMLLLTAIIMVFSAIMSKSVKVADDSKKNVSVPVEKTISTVQVSNDVDNIEQEHIAAIMAAVNVYLQSNNISGGCTIKIRPSIRASVPNTWAQANTQNFYN